MALPPLNIRKPSNTQGGRRKRLTLADLTADREQRLSAAKLAESEGFKLSKLDDYAKEAGLAAVGAITDTLAAPQRNIGSIVSGDGLVNPYSEEAEGYDPSDLLVKGPGKLTGLKGFAADVLLDPLNVTGVKVIANAAIRSGGKGLAAAAEQGAKETAKRTGQAGKKLPLSVTTGDEGADVMGVGKSIQESLIKDTVEETASKPGRIGSFAFGRKAGKWLREGDEDLKNAVDKGLAEQPTLTDVLDSAPQKLDAEKATLASLKRERDELNRQKADEAMQRREAAARQRSQTKGTRATLAIATGQGGRAINLSDSAGNRVRVPKRLEKRLLEEDGRTINLSADERLKYANEYSDIIDDTPALEKEIEAAKLELASNKEKSLLAGKAAKDAEDTAGIRGGIDEMNAQADQQIRAEQARRLETEAQADSLTRDSRVPVPKDKPVRDPETGELRVESRPGTQQVSPTERIQAGKIAESITTADLTASSIKRVSAQRQLDEARKPISATGRTSRQREIDIRKAQDEVRKANAEDAALRKTYAAQQAGAPEVSKGGREALQSQAEATGKRRAVARETNREVRQLPKNVREARQRADRAQKNADTARKKLAALYSFRDKNPLVPKTPMETRSKAFIERDAAVNKKIAAQEKVVEAAQRQADEASADAARFTAQQVDTQRKAALQEIMPEEVGSAIGLRFGRKFIPLAATNNETIVKGLTAAGKIPVVGAVGKALNEGFNPAAGSNKSVYMAKRIMVHAGTAATERDMMFIDRALEGVSQRNQQRLTDVFSAAADRPNIKGSTPDQWTTQAKELAQELQAARTIQQLAKAAPYLFTFTKKDLAEQAKRIKSLEADVPRLEAMAKTWDELDDVSKEAYNKLRGWYDDKLVNAKAFNLLDKAGERTNYIYTKKLNKEERRTRRQSTAPGEAAFMKEKKDYRLPDDYDVFEWARAYARDFNRTLYSREFTRMVSYRFAITKAQLNALPDAEREAFVKFDAAKDVVGPSLFIPKDIDQSLKNLTNLGVDPNAESLLLQGFNDFSSKWKALAYSNNFGHFLVDSIGDLWNTVVEHGVGVLPHLVKALDKDGPLYTTEQFLGALDKGLDANDIIKVRGKEMTVAELGALEVSVGKNKYRVDDLAFGYVAPGNRNTGRAAGDVGTTPNTAKGNLQNKIAIGDRDVRAPRLYKSYTTSMQRLGNKRDNFSKRVALVAALSLGASRGMAAREAAQFATRSVRRSLFDYSELTQFEKRIARNFVPFYTWTRKNVPYQARMALERPGTTLAPYKLQANLEDPSNPDYNTPDYLRSKYLRVGQLPAPLAKLIGQEKDKPFYLNPLLPAFDLGFLQNTRGGLDPSQALGMLSPAVRIPLELAAEKPTNFQTGAPIEGGIFGNNGGLPFLGEKGEYIFESALGQPGRQISRVTDKSLTRPERLMPVIGAQTGIRGTFADPEATRRGYEIRVKNERDERIRQLQAAGLIPTYDEIAEMRRANRVPAGFSTSRRKRLTLSDL